VGLKVSTFGGDSDDVGVDRVAAQQVQEEGPETLRQVGVESVPFQRVQLSFTNYRNRNRKTSHLL
jgi:hypothetical protein